MKNRLSIAPPGPARMASVLASLMGFWLGLLPLLAMGQVLTTRPPLSPKPPVAQIAKPAEPAAPPLSLTASDGSGLQIVSFSARAVVEDPLAFTELQLTFRNPQPRQIEGQFEITLPPGATISRFAMRQGQQWQEGEVVELQQARQAYEDFLHRRQDPALLEKQAGNQFHARVFPIPPSGEKQLIVSYSQELPRSADPYRIFLRGLPKLAALDIRAVVGKSEVRGVSSSLGGVTLSRQTIEVRKNDFTPDVDFVVPLPEGRATAQGLRHENLVVARVTPVTDARPDPVDSLQVLFDTSASRALGFKAQLSALGDLLGKLRQEAGPKLPLRVVCFDQDSEEIFSGALGDFGPRQFQKILDRRALGASDLSKALGAVQQGRGGRYARLVLFTDGMPTAGKIEGNDLRALVKELSAAGVRRLDAVAFGGIRDEELLGRLVTAGLPHDGVVADGELPAEVLVQRLQGATLSGIQVAVPGSTWVWPERLDGVQPGDQVLVYADLPADKPFAVELTGARQASMPVAFAQVERPLIERAWVNARIRRLMHQRDTLAANDADLRDALRHQVIDLSIKFRVLSDFTALLVLETEGDYARFHIDRHALSDILTVGASGIELLNRTQPVLVATPTEPQDLPKAANQAGKDSADARQKRDGGGDERRKKSAHRGAQREPMDEMLGLAPGASSDSAAPPPPPPTHLMPQAEAAMSPSTDGPMQEQKAMPSPARRVAPEARARPAAPQPSPAQGSAGLSLDAGQGGAASQSAQTERAATVARPPLRLSPPRMSQMSHLMDQTASGSVIAKMPEVVPYQGKLLEVMTLLKNQQRDAALRSALAWRDQDAGDVLALIALGETYEAQGNKHRAARAYGSLIDLFPGRADVRRFAGERLERLGGDGLALAIDTYTQARAQRPDHPASHRLLAYALLRAGRFAEAFDVIAEGKKRDYPPGRFAGVPRILAEDAGLIAAAWLHKEPGQKDKILARLAAMQVQLPTQPSLRFVLNWETDANDVDFHIFDRQGGHAFYSQRTLPSGGELYADVTTGYGPECFTIEGTPRAYPYKLQAHYYSRGPMGYGMGKLEIVEHDGKGGLRFAERPFVIMVDGAFVDLGQVSGPLPESRQ